MNTFLEAVNTQNTRAIITTVSAETKDSCYNVITVNMLMLCVPPITLPLQLNSTGAC